MADFAADAPVDALLRVDPALDIDVEGDDAAARCRQLTGMYRQWATKRRMQIKDIGAFHGKSMAILIITGFGAFRTLKEEADLHVLEVDQKSEHPTADRYTLRALPVAAGSRFHFCTPRIVMNSKNGNQHHLDPKGSGSRNTRSPD
jgi:ATP-dependent Clp protease ATP-binding subunit ClpC